MPIQITEAKRSSGFPCNECPFSEHKYDCLANRESHYTNECREDLPLYYFPVSYIITE